MDDFLFFAILIIVASILERVMKASKRKQQQQQQQPPDEQDWEPPEEDWEPQEGGAARQRPKTLQELIAEELGINLERRPQVQRLPQPEEEEPEPGVSVVPHARAQPPVPPDREVYYPTARSEAEVSGRERAELLARQRAEAVAKRRREVDVRRKAVPARSASRTPATLSLEERLVLERGEAVSLERQRQPRDHDRFHDRYGIPAPVESHTGFHDRYMGREAGAGQRRQEKKVRLPDRADWSPVKRAIVWAEVLGKPKGLD